MKKVKGLKCLGCGREYSQEEVNYNCPSCSENLDIVYDYEEIKTAIIDAVTKFVGNAPQHDDMAMVIMKIKKVNEPQVNKKINQDKKDIAKIKTEVVNPMDPHSIIV